MSVRCCPKADKQQIVSVCPLSAISVPTHPNKKHRYFDHLVGGHLDDQRHREAERLGGLEIDDQLEFGRLDYWKIGRLRTLENSADVDSRLAKRTDELVVDSPQ